MSPRVLFGILVTKQSDFDAAILDQLQNIRSMWCISFSFFGGVHSFVLFNAEVMGPQLRIFRVTVDWFV